MTTAEEGRRLSALKAAIVERFGAEDWLELGLRTGQVDRVQTHGRLLRSLDFGDADYSGHVLAVLVGMVREDPGNLEVIENYVRGREAGDVDASADVGLGRRIVFRPSVFQVPEADPEPDLISLMMPFGAGFDPVHGAVVLAAERNGLRCQRVDDIWEHSNVIQDVFSLIFRSHIVVCDLTGKNANVFYEAGIAHALGKHVVPITQHAGDVPFDLQAHRYLLYLANDQGLARLSEDLGRRLATLTDPGRRPGGAVRAR